MEGEGKSKKVAKEKRSVKKSTSVTLPAKEISAAPVANPAAAAAAPIGKDKSAKTKPAKKAIRSGNVREPTFEEIQLQAYYIGERRKKYGIPGDATSDWVEAEITLKAKFV
jgi:hypothetical protein